MSIDKQIRNFVIMEEKIEKLALVCVKEGKVLGLKEAQKALDEFLNQKISKGHPEYITRKELKIFMDTYISQAEDELKNNGD